ncbi:MAG: outer membrane protein assembly factor [Planctomycetota bacterium]
MNRSVWFLCVALAAAPARAQDPGASDPGRPGVPPRVAPGAQELPTVVSIHAVGQNRYTEAQIVEALGQKVGEPYDALRVGRGIENLFKAFRVRVDEVRVRDVVGGVEVEIQVVEFPVDLEPRFVGNAEVDKETLLRWAQLPEKGGELYLFQAERVRQRLIEGYRQEGYKFVDIDVVRRGEEPGSKELPDVIFEIREGPQVHVRDIVVRGNRSLPDRGWWFWRDGLKKLSKIELDGPTLFDWYGSKFDEEKLQADLLAMRNTYRDLGYLDAVVEVERYEYSDDKSRVTIHVVVDEGTPWRVASLHVRAVKRDADAKHPGEFSETPVELAYPEAELLALCKLKPGKRYERVKQSQDQAELRKRYGRDGYLSHPSLGATSWQFLEPELLYDFDKHEVAVTYKLAQGEQRYVREVLFEGTTHTRDRVLRREVDVMPGEKADIEEITRSLNRIYSTNFFSDEFAPLDHKDPTFRFQPVEGQPNWVDLYYQVEEGRVVNLQLQGGIDSNNGVFGRILLEMRNFDGTALPSSLWRMPGEIYEKEAFHGAGQRLVLELSPGTLVNSYQVRFVEPDLFGTQFDRTILDTNLSRRLRRYRYYDEDRNDRRVRFGREFGRNWTVWAGFSNQGIDVTDIEADFGGSYLQPGEFPLADSLFAEEGHSNLIGGLFDVNYRNVDRTLNPSEGLLAKWQNGVYGGVFGGDWDFVRSSLDFDWFWPFGSEEEDVRPGLHLSLGVGVADEFGSTRDVPYTERFFLGGNHILRGFSYRGVGPNKGGQPLGGETMASGSIEYKIPLYAVAQPGTYKKVEVFHTKLFVDAGILDPDAWSLDLDELRASVGFGFGMSYPIPISLNFGFPIQSGADDQRETFSFSIVNITF